MGIAGLLPVLRSITKHEHVSIYRGKKVAIDGYSWLHKGAYGCSQELCEGVATDKYIVYCMQRIALLRAHEVTPVVVFDGGRLPMKQNEEGSRASSRQESLEKARALVANGNPAASFDYYQRAVDISPSVAKGFIEALKLEGVEFIVAPYEADAQMAFLARSEKVHAVITEDSDMLPYGCPRVFFKMDKTGEGHEICLSDLGSNRGLSFVGFTHQMFLEMCILAGCDFLKALPGIGMKKAHLNMRKYRGWVRVVKNLRFGKTSVPAGYEAAFQRALWTFQHQRVFDEDTRRLTYLSPLPEEGLVAAAGVPDSLHAEDPEFRFLGPALEDSLAAAIACGDVDPITRKPFQNLCQPQQLRSASNFCSQSQKGGKGAKQKGLAAFFNPVRRAEGRSLEAMTNTSSLSGFAESAEGTNGLSGDSTEKLSADGAGPASQRSLPSRFLPYIAGVSSQSQPLASSGNLRVSQLSSNSGGDVPSGLPVPSIAANLSSGGEDLADFGSCLQLESAKVLAEAAELLGPTEIPCRVAPDASRAGELSQLSGQEGLHRTVESGSEPAISFGCYQGPEPSTMLTGVAESPKVDDELRRIRAEREQILASPVAGGKSHDSGSMESPPSPAPTIGGHARATSPPTANREYYAVLSPLEAPESDAKHREDEADGNRRRLPLSPVSVPPPSNGCKKRKISHFFGKKPKRQRAENRNVGGDGPPLGDGLPTKGRICKGDPWSQVARAADERSIDEIEDDTPDDAIQMSHDREDDEEETSLPGSNSFHSLKHLPKYTATAARVVDKLAARCGMQGEASSSRQSVLKPVRKPFKVPKKSAPVSIEEDANGAVLTKGCFRKFAFKAA